MLKLISFIPREKIINIVFVLTEQQLGTLEQVNLATAQNDRARALGHLGDCYDALGDFEEGIKCHEKHLQLAIALQNPRDQERAYCGLGKLSINLKSCQHFQYSLGFFGNRS